MAGRTKRLSSLGHKVWAWVGMLLFFVGFWLVPLLSSGTRRTIFDYWRPLLPLMLVGSTMLALESRGVSRRALVVVLLAVPLVLSLLLFFAGPPLLEVARSVMR